MQDTLFSLLLSEWRRFALALLALVVATALSLLAPLVAGYAIDGLLAGEPAYPLWALALAMIFLTALSGAGQYLRGRWTHQASETIVRRLRERLHAHLERLPCAYHDRADTGDLVQRCTSDVETLRLFLSEQVVEIGRATLITLLAVPLLAWLHPPLAGLTVLLLPALVLFGHGYFVRLRRLFRAADEAEGRLTTVLQENLSGIRVVRAFANQSQEQARFGVHNATFRDLNGRVIRAMGNYWAVSEGLIVGQFGIVLLAGAAMVQAGQISVGVLFAFLQILTQMVWPLRQLGRVLTETGKATVALERLREILAVAEERDPDRPLAPAPARGSIRVRDLWFGYDPGRPVLQGLNLEIAPGETVVLIGPPGSGKSTLAQLLLRLYDYQQGSIELDGQELTRLPRAAVRERVGAVLQAPFLYSRTVGANLRVGAERPLEALQEAAGAAAIHDAIQTLPQGYETLVGERGVTLSGGQRQRLSLARTLLRDPPLLILDDSLSAVDTHTEAKILATLTRRRGRASTLLIAHRLSSVQIADRILVLDQGRVVQSGSHRQLLTEPGPYRSLWHWQNALATELAADIDTATLE